MQTSSLYDMTIIGAGPIGLYTAFYSGLRSMKTKVIDAEPGVGGKIRYFYPEKLIHDIGGIAEISGAELVQNFKRQAETFQPKFVLGNRVVGLTNLHDGTFVLTTENGEQHFSKTVVIACGNGTYKVAPLEADHAEKHKPAIHYHLSDIEKFRGKKVVVSGGGDAAIDAAFTLNQTAAQVDLIYRGESFKGYEERAKELMDSEITVHLHHEITALNEENDLEKITVCCKTSNQQKQLDCEALFISHGVEVDFSFATNWGLQTEEWGIAVDELMQTNIPGVYACGDTACYPRKIRIIAAGLHEAAIAVNSAKQHLEPGAAPEAMVSTHHEHFM
ncbi:pyridine nucleotide-disulfide oxidoreductase [Listeria floridensis FSL S10-1187]|uniref:Ferredoxin--NADP reductase n=1 Tax=Listeria floridensis FSL S10-1187 TaxID=1265817 RepID=A0ABN0RGG6_9LIST|nr:NAD(P)/FAD-dependent oxidoreductase [Listeria floridensis]EUJ32904.1 pyridine nucleotide-disulfide oxidoreductase [Listeria floridensis FSL S10-1187]